MAPFQSAVSYSTSADANRESKKRSNGKAPLHQLDRLSEYPDPCCIVTANRPGYPHLKRHLSITVCLTLKTLESSLLRPSGAELRSLDVDPWVSASGRCALSK